jgi:hypothetical protein
MPSRRVLALVLAFLLVLFGGDRLLAHLLRRWVETSSQVHAALYTGRGAPADVVFAGSSRSREHFPVDRLEQRTERRIVNLGWGGLSSDQAAAIFLDHVQRYGPPRILVLEVTSPEIDDVMIRNLRLFEHDSARIRKLVAETEPVLYHAGRLFELLRYNNKLFFDIVRYDFDKEDYLTDAVIGRGTLAEIRAETSIEWEYRQEDIQATADLVRIAGDMGVIVVPLITPILPDYLERLDGFEEWRRRLRAALPADVTLRDYSTAITEVASFRDDLHLNRQGVLQLMSSLRRDRVPGFL